LGAFLTGLLATSKVNPNLDTNLKGIVGHTLWLEQLKAIGLTLCLAVVGTFVLAYAVKALVGLRVSEDIETAGLDLAEHGEEAYHGV
jgi:Amt family ammonium transporter